MRRLLFDGAEKMTLDCEQAQEYNRRLNYALLFSGSGFYKKFSETLISMNDGSKKKICDAVDNHMKTCKCLSEEEKAGNSWLMRKRHLNEKKPYGSRIA